MNFKGLLVALVLLAALGGGIYWSNRDQDKKKDEPDKDAPPKILALAKEDFQEIRVTRPGGESLVLARDADGKWSITEPRLLAADQDAVSSLVSTLSSLSSDRLVDETIEDKAAFGLDAPKLTVTVKKKDAATHTLIFGDDTPTGGNVFTMLEGDPRLFTVASWTRSTLDKRQDDLRDRRLLTVDADRLSRVELTARNETIEFGRNAANEWQILKPRPGRADSSQVEELLRVLREAKMDLTTPEAERRKAQAAFSGAERAAVVNVSDDRTTQTLEVRRDRQDKVYARSTGAEGVHSTTTELADGLTKEFYLYRNKKLFDFGWSDPTKVEAGDKVYERQDAKWLSAGKEMESVTVNGLVDYFRDLTAHMIDDFAKPSGDPALKLAVTSDEGKRVERVNLYFREKDFVAFREGEPEGYVLTKEIYEGLQKELEKVKDKETAEKERKAAEKK